MHRDTAVKLLKTAVAGFATKKQAAEQLSISVKHLDRVLNEKHEIPEHICTYLGIQKHVLTTYTKVPK